MSSYHISEVYKGLLSFLCTDWIIYSFVSLCLKFLSKVLKLLTVYLIAIYSYIYDCSTNKNWNKWGKSRQNVHWVQVVFILSPLVEKTILFLYKTILMYTHRLTIWGKGHSRYSSDPVATCRRNTMNIFVANVANYRKLIKTPLIYWSLFFPKQNLLIAFIKLLINQI